MVLFNGACLDNCPEGYHRSKVVIKMGSESLRCSSCHYSCKTCSGPADSNCTTCFPDATITPKGNCHSSSLVNQVITLERWYSTVTIVFTICCLIILLLIIYILVGRSNDLICCIVETKRAHRSSSSSSSRHHRHPHSLNHSRFSYVDLPTNHNHHHVDHNNRRRSSSQRVSITCPESREILNSSKKMLTDQTSEDDL